MDGIMSYKILTQPNPILSTPAEKVEAIDNKIKYIIDRMYNIIQSKGVGLAAPQIGVSKRIIVLNTKGYEDGVKISLCNPEITSHSEETVSENEKCLSCPGHEIKITRWKEITVTGLDFDGNTTTVELKGISSRAAQQEIDHINGILIIDKKGE
jgi:peptide deformylase